MSESVIDNLLCLISYTYRQLIMSKSVIDNVSCLSQLLATYYAQVCYRQLIMSWSIEDNLCPSQL